MFNILRTIRLFTKQKHKGFFEMLPKTMTTKERALKGANERWNPSIPRATHSGILVIGNIELACDVLEDGRRILRQKTFLNAMGKGQLGKYDQERGKSLNLPVFLTANNLTPYFESDFQERGILIHYKSVDGRKCTGYEASLLPEACKVYVRAADDGKLIKGQKKIGDICRIIIYSLASVGITALIDEVTGYQKVRDRNELQKLFSAFIAKELQPWIKRFPDSFFVSLKRIYGLDEMKGNPSFFGTLINKWIYKELSPEIHDELRRLNPITENGRRKTQHHRLLTQDIGCVALDKQISKITTLLSVSDSIEEFEKLLCKSKK